MYKRQSLRRKQIDRDLEDILGKKCEQWGVTVISVEIRDIMIPKELQDALSKDCLLYTSRCV